MGDDSVQNFCSKEYMLDSNNLEAACTRTHSKLVARRHSLPRSEINGGFGNDDLDGGDGDE
jgi:hypothetical protein